MFTSTYVSASHFHDEYRRCHVKDPKLLDMPRHELRRTVGHRLIRLDEKLAQIERPLTSTRLRIPLPPN